MVSVTREEIFKVDIADLYETLIDYESYPKFVKGVSDPRY
jgi:hypothetical protein